MRVTICVFAQEKSQGTEEEKMKPRSPIYQGPASSSSSTEEWPQAYPPEMLRDMRGLMVFLDGLQEKIENSVEAAFPTETDILEHAFSEGGIQPNPELAESLSEAIHGLSELRAAKLTAKVLFDKVPSNSIGGIVLEHYLLNGTESIHELARRADTDPSNIRRAMHTLRRFLG